MSPSTGRVRKWSRTVALGLVAVRSNGQSVLATHAVFRDDLRGGRCGMSAKLGGGWTSLLPARRGSFAGSAVVPITHVTGGPIPNKALHGDHVARSQAAQSAPLEGVNVQALCKQSCGWVP
jgi:hypothetical protein